MLNGDLASSPSSERWLVTLDVISAERAPQSKPLFKSWTRLAQECYLDRQVNGYLWQLHRRGLQIRFECVVFGMHHDFCDRLQQRFDEEGWLLFTTTPFRTRSDLQRDLAVRPDVRRVLDVNALTWGSRGLTLMDLRTYG